MNLMDLSKEITNYENQVIPNTHIVDGIAICNECQQPKQCRIKMLGEYRLLSCMCQCEKASYEAEQAELKKNITEAEINHNRAMGLITGKYSNTFENAVVDDENRQIIAICKAYTDAFDVMYEKNIGLKLWGSTGSGKSFVANCIANKLIDNGYRVYFATSGMIVNDMQMAKDRNAYIDDICDYDLLIIDDLGAERNTETAAQYIEDVIDRRVTRSKPLIVTTNISDYSAASMREKRLYSRLDGMMQAIKCVGNDKRKIQHNTKSDLFKDIIKGVLQGNGTDMR